MDHKKQAASCGVAANPDSALVAGRAAKRQGVFYGWIVVVAGLFITIILSGLFYAYGVFFQPLLQEFGWSRATTAGAFSLCMLTYGALVPLAGVLTDRYGPRTTVAACGLLVGTGYALMSLIGAAWQLYLLYSLLVGLGYSAGFVPLASTVARWFTEKRGLALGIVLAGVGIGAMIMAPLTEHLISSFGWRTAYFIAGLMVWAIVIPSALLLKRDPRDAGLLPYGQRTAAPAQHPASRDAISAVGKKEAGTFTLRQAINTRFFWALIILYALAMVGAEMVMIHLVPYGLDTGLSPATAATLLTVFGGFGVVGRLAMGLASDRIGGRSGVAICLGIQTISMFWFARAEGLWTLYLFAAIFGFGYGGSVPMFPVIAGELFGVQAMGAVFGGITVGAATGSALGAWLAGIIFDVTGSYRLAFLSGALILALAGVLALLLRKARRPNTTTERKATVGQ